MLSRPLNTQHSHLFLYLYLNSKFFLYILQSDYIFRFRRVANIYFLAMSTLMIIGTDFPTYFESPLSPYSTLVPLTMVLSLTMIKEGVEDLKRHKSDWETNRRSAEILSAGGIWVEKKWRDIVAGDIAKVNDRCELPADVILLSSSHDNNGCYIETSNIDGETNLKIRSAVVGVDTFCESSLSISQISGSIEFELPNKSIHTFEAALSLDNSSESTPIGPQNLLLRGSLIR